MKTNKTFKAGGATETKILGLLAAVEDIDNAQKLLVRRLKANDLQGASEWCDVLQNRVSHANRKIYHAKETRSL